MTSPHNSIVRRLAPIGAAVNLLASTPSAASNADFGYVNTLYSTQGGAVLFSTSGARTTPPSCQATSVPQRFAIDASSIAGQAQVSLFIKAYERHKRIYIVGAGACSIWGDSETVSYFQIEDKLPYSGSYSIVAKVDSVMSSGSTNYAFRVYVVSATSCIGAFLFKNEFDDNYNAYVSILESAYIAGNQVSITYEKDTSGYCHIVDASSQ